MSIGGTVVNWDEQTSHVTDSSSCSTSGSISHDDECHLCHSFTVINHRYIGRDRSVTGFSSHEVLRDCFSPLSTSFYNGSRHVSNNSKRLQEVRFQDEWRDNSTKRASTHRLVRQRDILGCIRGCSCWCSTTVTSAASCSDRVWCFKVFLGCSSCGSTYVRCL